MFQNESLAEKLIKRGFFLYFFSFLIAPSGYIVKLIISNDLSVAEVGIIYSIISLISILSNYNDLGLSESVKYFLPKFWFENKFSEFKTTIFWAFLFQFVTAVLIGFGLWVGAGWLAVNYFHSPEAAVVLKIFSIFFVIFNIFKTIENILFVFQDTFWSKFLDFVRMRLIVLVTLIIFVKGWGSLISYSSAWLISMILVSILAIIVFLKKYRFVLLKGNLVLHDKVLLKKIVKYALWVVVAIQGGILLGNIDQQMIVYFLGPQMAGYYTTYWSMLNIYSLVIGPIFGFLFPITSELISRKEERKLKILLNIFYKYFPVFGFIFGIFMLFFGPYVAYVLFGEKFVYSGYLLQIGALFVAISIIIAINFNILAGLGKVKERAKIVWIAAIINFIANFILLKIIGVVGAIISTIICWFLMSFLSYVEIKKVGINWKIDWIFWIKNILFSLLVAISIRFLIKSDLTFDKSRGYVLLVLFGIGFVYVVGIMLFNYLELMKLYKEVKKVMNKQGMADRRFPKIISDDCGR